MTKAELISSVAKKTGIEKSVIASVIEASMDSIKETMAEGDNIYLRGFGSFILKNRAEKVARNISKNTTITIPAHRIAAFKPAKEFQKSIKQIK